MEDKRSPCAISHKMQAMGYVNNAMIDMLQPVKAINS